MFRGLRGDYVQFSWKIVIIWRYVISQLECVYKIRLNDSRLICFVLISTLDLDLSYQEEQVCISQSWYVPFVTVLLPEQGETVEGDFFFLILFLRSLCNSESCSLRRLHCFSRTFLCWASSMIPSFRQPSYSV